MTRGQRPTSGARNPRVPVDRDLLQCVTTACQSTRQWLLTQQHPDGYWCGELEGDTILESETVLLLAWLDELDHPVVSKAARYLLQQQQAEGGWSQYPGGPLDVSVSVKAYFALKLAGYTADQPELARARTAIRAHGGADKVNSFTRFYLALLGQISYDQCPSVPPEAVLLPTWFPINIYHVSAWSRTMLVPLSIVSACRPARNVADSMGIGELFLREPDQWAWPECPGLAPSTRWLNWRRLFLMLDQSLKWLDRRRIHPLRPRAMRTAEHWITERMEDSDGLGAIFPPVVWSIIALKCLGHDDSSPSLRQCRDQLDAWTVPLPGDMARIQPCASPVWDTAIGMQAMVAAGEPAHEASLCRAARWLLSKEVTRPGDWARSNPSEPGGWFFEHRNGFYPDVDDTAMVLIALRDQFAGEVPNASPAEDSMVAMVRASSANRALDYVSLLDHAAAASRRGRRWMLGMQNRDGGWGAFDRDNNRQYLCHAPFADHNALIDPSTADLTGRVLQALGRWDMACGQAAVDRGVAFLRRNQESDGSWYGRWGVNYIYGTWQALEGLRAVRVPQHDPMVDDAAQWLLRHQQADGGWGESAHSYADPQQRGQGPVTASQTAWALMGLMAAGRMHSPEVERGVRFLIESQEADGTWQEEYFTGTGFPRVFYLRYHLYPIYFPLLALARWNRACTRTR